MKILEYFFFFSFLGLLVFVISYLPSKVNVIKNIEIDLNEHNKNSENLVHNTTNYNNIVKIDNYIVALVLEWYPINSNNPEKGWIFQNTLNWLKQGGFKIIPIFPWYKYDEIKKILQIVNSVVWMGGMQDFKKEMNGNIENFYHHILKNIEENQLPSLLICQGFQLMTGLYAGENILTEFNNSKGWFNKDNLNLMNFSYDSDNHKELIDYIHQDKLYYEFNYTDFLNFQNKNVSFHFHQYGFSPDNFNKVKYLHENFVISSTGVDNDGKTFVNSVYHKTLPIHGVQYHPEVANNMSYRNNRGEDYKESRTISFKILNGFKKMINDYSIKDKYKNNIVINDLLLESLYEISTIDIILTEEYYTGKTFLKGYMFNKNDFPFKMLR
jgi:GMP synthase-like glutamine amidotransferase